MSDAVVHHTICRCCIALCGLEVAVVDDRVVKVKGDAEHPVSHGYTCPKGRAFAFRHDDPDRLSHPTIRGERVSWDECLDDIASTMRRMIDEGGPDRVGFYCGTGSSGTEAVGLPFVKKMMTMLGSQQHYSAQTVDIAPFYKAAELVTGFPSVFPFWQPDAPDEPSLALLFGFNPVVSHAYGNTPHFSDPVRRLRAFKQRGGELWVIDPRRTETAMLADHHLAVRPGTDAAVLAWLVRELLVDGADASELAAACDPADVQRLHDAVAPFHLDDVARLSGVEPELLLTLLASVRRHGKIATATGTGLPFGRHGVVAEWLRWALLIVTGSADRPGGMRFARHLLPPAAAAHPAPPEGRFGDGPPSRPELRGILGERPAAAIVDEIDAGELRGFFVQGGNPLTAFPNAKRVTAAFEQLELCVVVDTFHTDVTRLATHVLPGVWHLERADFWQITHEMYTPQVLPVGGERKPAWWIYGQIAKRLGLDLFDGAVDVDSCTEDDVLRHMFTGRGDFDELKARGTHGRPMDRPVGWVHEVLPDGHWRIAPPVLVERLPRVWERAEGHRLIPTRIMRNNNSVAYESSPPPIRIGVDDAAALGVSDGDRVQVVTGRGSVEGPVETDARLRPGVVSVTHGWLDRNVCELTDEFSIDPLTGQPEQTDIPVELVAMPAAASGT